METLPEPLLVRILASIPAVELVMVCRLVCSQWRNLIDGAALWLLKCQQEGFTGQDAEEEAAAAANWQILYFLNKRKRNLIKNPHGEGKEEMFKRVTHHIYSEVVQSIPPPLSATEAAQTKGLEHWVDVENGGDGWKIEDLPGDFGKGFPSDEAQKYFVSSFEWCRKAQVIDLRAEGYWEELMDTSQPKIVVKDWYAARCDAGCLYDLSVKLLSETEEVLAEYQSDTIAIPQDNEGEWIEIAHTFTDYSPGVRFVRFEHGGQDTVFWKGWYGARVTHSSVTVEL